jgi:hypothetical protein
MIKLKKHIIPPILVKARYIVLGLSYTSKYVPETINNYAKT